LFITQIGSNYAAPNEHNLSFHTLSDNIMNSVASMPGYLSNAVNRVRSTVKDTSKMMKDAVGSTGENMTSFLRKSGSAALDFGTESTEPVKKMIKSGTQTARRLSSFYRDLFNGITNTVMP
jgi:phosphotransferase system IIB component